MLAVNDKIALWLNRAYINHYTCKYAAIFFLKKRVNFSHEISASFNTKFPHNFNLCQIKNQASPTELTKEGAILHKLLMTQ